MFDLENYYPIAGPQLLSQGSSGSYLRSLSDSINSVYSSVSSAEALGVSYFDGRCACGEVLFILTDGYWIKIHETQIDHILPASAGHLAAAGNLRPLCPSCNGSSMKGGESYKVLYIRLEAAGKITHAEAEEGIKRTEEFFNTYYFSKFPELRNLEISVIGKSTGEDMRYVAEVIECYKKLEDQNKIIWKVDTNGRHVRQLEREDREIIVIAKQVLKDLHKSKSRLQNSSAYLSKLSLKVEGQITQEKLFEAIHEIYQEICRAGYSNHTLNTEKGDLRNAGFALSCVFDAIYESDAIHQFSAEEICTNILGERKLKRIERYSLMRDELIAQMVQD